MNVTIYHNPRCSKSRRTLEIIREHGIEPTVVEYLKTPPSADELKDILARLDKAPRDLMRRGEAPYRDENLDDPSLTDDDLIAAMVRHPILIERPVVRAGDRVALGRPPESVAEIL